MKNSYTYTAYCTRELYDASVENPRLVCEKTFTNKAEAKKTVRKLFHGNLMDTYTLKNDNTGEVLMSYNRKHRKG